MSFIFSLLNEENILIVNFRDAEFLPYLFVGLQLRGDNLGLRLRP